jgi:dipeptidyl aminopeptidase/acylaminoacyl peptidase
MFRYAVLTSAVGALMISSVPVRAELPPLIPRKVLFGNPAKASPLISPDGKRVAFLAPDKNDVLQVWVQTAGKDDAKQVTADKKRGIRIHLWSYAPDVLLYLQDNDGDENYHVYSVDLKENLVRDLTPFQGVRAEPVDLNPEHPDEILVAMNVKDRRLNDVYRVNLKTGAVEFDTKNPGDVVGWVVDATFNVRGAQAALRDGGAEVRVRDNAKSEWKKFVTWGPDESESHVLGFNKEGDSLWLLNNDGRDTLALTKREIASGKETVIAAEEGVDAGAVFMHPTLRMPLAVAFDREKTRWKVIEDAVGADFKSLEDANKGDINIHGTDKEFKTWVVSYTEDTKPTRYFLYDRASRKLTTLFDSRPDLAKYELAPMKPVTIKSRDGLDLVCYLTLPAGVEAKKLPLVLMVHGGPWSRDRWGFNATAQWLANRGYAVLSVNYRGSTGFGKKFVTAGNREWAGKMHDDLIDAVKWAVKEGYADEKRVAIYGTSYGGYAALVGATFTPDVFVCAVDVVGPSNLVTLMKSIPPYWEPIKRQFAVRIGDVEKEEDFLKSRSPLFKADKIKIPLLIGQGANDPRVKQAESEQIVEAVRKAGKPVEYIVFEDEGHGFARPENRLKFNAAMEAFLAKHLGGGRVESEEKTPK